MKLHTLTTYGVGMNDGQILELVAARNDISKTLDEFAEAG